MPFPNPEEELKFGHVVTFIFIILLIAYVFLRMLILVRRTICLFLCIYLLSLTITSILFSMLHQEKAHRLRGTTTADSG